MSSNSMAAPQVYYRQYNVGEKTMKKIVILGGSFMMFILFLLIFIVNIRDQEWHEEKLIAFCISTVGLVIFSSILISYGIYHLKRERIRSANSSICTPVDRNENELPPTYEEIMGKLPSYDSYSKSTAKQIKDNENTHYICHV
ncbi:hypothetical protein PVAND_008930 [Polypedilum vanderplanki]|uniref:Uncharacterized protein n=1 Tax=Polypedilum vanderplanki TaxID=319348 RepID=A0A9J6CBW7_POLVA|nr:hypothetical protein PVAND_008930 [Polypedilum vanderplanki]